MAFLTDEANWQPLINSFYSQSQGAINIPIYQPIISHTIRIQIRSDSANPRWWLGGYLQHLLNSPDVLDPMIAASIKIPLNWHYLLKLDRWSEIYYLQFEPVAWLNDFHLKLEYFLPQGESIF